MKKSIIIIFFFTHCLQLCYSQTPHSFKYQAVIRNNQGQIIQNQLVSLKISIKTGPLPTSPISYSETHYKATSEFGIVNLNVGQGTPITGLISNINWGSGDYWIEVALDITGGGNYSFIGTNQLLSVPYALYAEKTAGSENDHDTSSTNEIQAISFNNDTLYLSNGGKVYLGSYLDDTDTDNQTLSMPNPTTLSISNGNSVTLSAGMADLDADPINELQYISYSNDTIYLSQGNYVVLPHDADLDSLNEIQLLSKAGNQISLSKNGGIVTDDDNQNLSSSINGTQRTINISGGTGTTIDVADNDNNTTNELQTLSFSNDSVSISDGNSVYIYDFNIKSLDFPQGIKGPKDVLHNSDTLNVPTGKTCYVLSGNGYLKINGLPLNYYLQADGLFNKPVFSSGTSVISYGNMYYVMINNNTNIEPVFANTTTNYYVVPTGKLFVLKSVSQDFPSISSCILYVDYGTGSFQQIELVHSYEVHSHSTFIFPSGSVITNSQYFTGYLLNEQ